MNFLCVHNKYRKHRLAPILIMELTRRANHDGIYQAIYTSGTKIHAPFTVTSYYHRLINRHKLIKCGFSPASYNKDMDKVTDKINEIKIVILNLNLFFLNYFLSYINQLSEISIFSIKCRFIIYL